MTASAPTLRDLLTQVRDLADEILDGTGEFVDVVQVPSEDVNDAVGEVGLHGDRLRDQIEELVQVGVQVGLSSERLADLEQRLDQQRESLRALRGVVRSQHVQDASAGGVR